MSFSDRVAALTPEQRALFEKLREKQRKAASLSERPPIRRVSGPAGEGDWPLTFDQERLWFLEQLDPGGAAYNMPAATRLRGRLDVPALAAAIRAVVRRHGAWRTTFPSVGGVPVQRVARDLRLEVPVLDLEALPPDRREPAARALAADDARRPFSLETGPLLRATLLRLNGREHLCLLTVHHLVCDLVSFHVFWGELASLYDAFLAGRPSPLPELEVQYADFAVWQREWMRGEVLAAQIDGWRRQLEGFPQVLDLPADRPRQEGTGRGAKLRVELGRRATAGVRELARREGATRFMTLLAVCAALFSRLSGQNRLVVGTLNANRQRPELAPVVGFFLTQLPLGIDLSGDPSFRELIARARTSALRAFAHQDLPFGKLVEAVQPERELGRQPLVQSLFQLIDAQEGGWTLGDLQAEAVDPFDAQVRYETMFALFEHPDSIAGPLEYDAGLFDAATAARMAEVFQGIAGAVAENPDLRLSDLPVWSEASRQQLAVEWNDTRLPVAPVTVDRLFEGPASSAPDAVAWSGEGWSVTRGELDARSNRLARHLRRLGAGPEVLVGVWLERAAELPVALLGILKSGAAYLPLDLSHPAERRAAILEDSGAPLIVTREPLLAGLPATGARKVCLDAEAGEIARESAAPLPATACPDDRAYVLYTSGSTGRPKGVEIPHRALASFLAAMRELYQVGPGDAMPVIASTAFDISAAEMYLPMLGGGTTVLFGREQASDGRRLARALDDHGATFVQATPSTYRQLLDSGWPGRPEMLLLCGAEALDRDLADRLLPRGRSLWNFYGPTETTVWSAAWRVEPEGPVSIGRPVANTRLVLLDAAFAPVPLGAVGEVSIGGSGLARGYLGRPGLTAERFVPDPFSGEPGARLYRTGDLGRQRADGLLDYLGRTDHQVKLRGFRIELGEVEAALRRHPAVSEAAVIRREDRPGDARLVAFLGVAPGAEAPEPRELRDLLSGSLPEFMVPSAFVPLPALPRNANGKLDRGALARLRPAFGAGAERGRVAPRTPTEEVLAGIWSQVLEVPEVGSTDGFFELGGHSLLATRVVARVREAFGVELPVRAAFQAPTLAALAERIDRARAGGESPRALPLRRVPRTGPAPLSFAQERLWFLDRLSPGTAVYNLPIALRVRGDLRVPLLERAFAEVVRRHEGLRTTFVLRDGQPGQVVAAAGGGPLPVADLSAAPDGEARAREAVRELALEPFDLERGPLLRTLLLRLGDGEHVLAASVHHIVADLWAVGILVREVAAVYGALAAGRRPELPELPVQYADFAAWQREWLAGAELERQLDFWRRELAGAPPGLDLPADRPRPAVASFRGASVPLALDPATTAGLARLGRERGATPFMVLASALGAVLARWSGSEDVVLGLPIANRRLPELEPILGMFVNTLALRVRTEGDPRFESLLARVRHAALDAYDHQDLPFERLVEELQPRRDPSRHPVFQVVLAFQNVQLPTVELPGLLFEPLAADNAATQFELTFTLFETGAGIGGRIDYATDLFDAGTVERLAGHLRSLAGGAATAPEAPLSELPLLAEEELRQVLVEGARSTAGDPRESTIHELFARRAAERPGQVAVVCGDRSLTYGDLDRLSGALAGRLRSEGVAPEVRVGVLLDRSPELIVALLATLRAGGAYLPLDLGFPAERLALMLRDSAAPLLVTRGDLVRSLPEGALPAGVRVLFADEPAGEEAGEAAPAPSPATAENLAYVMYTSGSTGAPKGVAVTHRNVVRLVRGADYAEMGPEEVFLQYAPASFDASTLEVWAPLLNGGRLAMVPQRRASLDDLAATIERDGVTAAWLTAGLFHRMVEDRPEALRPLGQLLAGGDVLSPAHVRKVLETFPGLTLVNGYGPTEGTTFSCCHRMTGSGEAFARSGSVPIGRPIAGARASVLGPSLAPVPPGAAGELCVGGDGLARGYLGDPERTAERFVPDPFAGWWGEPGARLYRTGDLARLLPGDRFEFLGRNDAQVKVRGFRVEPGEVEATLAESPEVAQAAVGVREGPAGGRELVAWVVPRECAAADLAARLQRFLHERLPEPFVPSAWAVVEALPLGPNGKLDRRALAAREASRAAAAVPRVSPRTPLEERLVAACAEVLGLENGAVGAEDNFFDLGGHSLLAVQFVARLRDRWGIEVPLQDLFEESTFREIADRITERELGSAGEEVLEEVLAEVDGLSHEELRAILEGGEDAPG